MSSVVSIETARQERMSDDKPALNDGYCRVVNAVAEGLASHPLTSIQQRVLWGVIRYTYGWNKAKDRIAASQLAEFTGLRRQQCSTALNQLIDVGVIIREGGSRSAIKINTKTDEWSFEKKATKALINERVNTKHELCSVNSNCGHSTNSNHGHTKDKRQSNKNTPYSLSSEGEKKPASPKKKKPDSAPCEELRDLYHEILPELTECRVLSSKRIGQLNARWNQTVGKSKKPCNNLDFWRRFFTYVRKCPWLMGEIPPQDGRRQFVASLEWITNENNFAKIIEGEYDPERGGE